MIISWGTVFTESLKGIWLGVANFLPSFIAALIIFILGWIIASILGKLVSQLIGLTKVDNALRAAGFEKTLEKGGFKLNSGNFVGALIKWFFIIVFLVASLEILGLQTVTEFLRGVVLGYLPQVIVAVLMILVAAVLAEAMQKVVAGSARAAGIRSANFAGNITKWAIWIFAILAVLVQLGIAVSFINTLFTGVIIAISLALGLAFGLGGQDAASQIIEKMRGEIADR